MSRWLKQLSSTFQALTQCLMTWIRTQPSRLKQVQARSLSFRQTIQAYPASNVKSSPRYTASRYFTRILISVLSACVDKKWHWIAAVPMLGSRYKWQGRGQERLRSVSRLDCTVCRLNMMVDPFKGTQHNYLCIRIGPPWNTWFHSVDDASCFIYIIDCYLVNLWGVI